MERCLSPEEASKYLGMSPANIRKEMREGRLDLGYVIPPIPGRKSWKYYIYRGKLKRFIGEDIDDEEGIAVCTGDQSKTA